MVRRPRQSGVALLLVLILVASASVLGLSYVTRSTIKLSGSNNLIQAGKARYLAESGLAHGLRTLRVVPWNMSYLSEFPLGPYTLDAQGGAYTMYASSVAGKSNMYTLTSSGTSTGITQSVQQTVRFDSRYYELMMDMDPHDYWRLGETSGTKAEAEKGSDGEYRYGVLLGWDGAINHDVNGSALFWGGNGYVDLGDGFDIHQEQMSLVAWVYPYSGIGSYARVISKSYNTNLQSRYWQIALDESGGERRFRFSLKTETDYKTKSLTASSGKVKLGEWTLVVATYDGSRMRLYKDAVEVGSMSHSGKVAQNNHVGAWIGGDPTWPTSRPWCGWIDEVAVFHRALSADEIKTLYEARIPDIQILSWD